MKVEDIQYLATPHPFKGLRVLHLWTPGVEKCFWTCLRTTWFGLWWYVWRQKDHKNGGWPLYTFWHSWGPESKLCRSSEQSKTLWIYFQAQQSHHSSPWNNPLWVEVDWLWLEANFTHNSPPDKSWTPNYCETGKKLDWILQAAYWMLATICNPPRAPWSCTWR